MEAGAFEAGEVLSEFIRGAALEKAESLAPKTKRQKSAPES